jgi:hypothetical protein
MKKPRGRPTGTTKSNKKRAISITLSPANLDWVREQKIALSTEIDLWLTTRRWEAQRVAAIIVAEGEIREMQ